jgi:DNA-binding transcriptional MerR regulator
MKPSSIQGYTVTNALTAPAHQETFDIEQTSKACGLSAGVLRMWELRYGWPRPSRLPNGYRYFTAYQIEELKRMAVLVKSGMMISRMIDHGMPKWPGESVAAKQALRVTLETTRALPKPRSEIGLNLCERLTEAIKNENDGCALELLQRCAWEVHPSEQALAGWLPCLVSLEEYRVKGLPFPRHDALLSYVTQHCKGALGRMNPGPHPLWLIPLTEQDHSWACLGAVLMSLNGTIARPWLWDKLPGASFITVGAETPAANRYPADVHRGHLTRIGRADCRGVSTLASAP